jgi:hypothetical protein
MMDAPSTFAPDLRAVMKVLGRHRVAYVICGGVACILHGVSRVTQDIDLCVEMTDENLNRLIAAAKDLGLSPRIPEPISSILSAERRREWIVGKGAQVYTLVSSNSPLQIDVFLEYPIPYSRLAQDAVRRTIDGTPVLVSSPAHLIEAKRSVQPPRRVDLQDIEALEELFPT